MPNQKKVKFNNIVNAVLIPCAREYKLLELSKELWWEKEDYVNFRLSANREIYELMQQHHGFMNYKDAQQLLFQPFRYNVFNFF